jgi:predicted ATPase
VPTIAGILNFPLQNQDKRSPQQQLVEYLRRKRMLLILDNFEHLLDGTGLVAAVLEVASWVQILATSRERLRLRSEQVLPLAGLAYGDEMMSQEESPDGGARTAAAALFLMVARRVEPAFKLASGDRKSLARICRLVAGMPLALELAATWVDTLSLAGIAGEIEGGLDFLETDMSDMPQRHRSMRAVFETSWQHLDGEGRQLLAQLSVFRGGFSREAAQAVTGVSLPTLVRLAGRSLLQFQPGGDRYQIHELLRQFAAEKLASSPYVDAPARHAAYYAAFMQQQAADLKGAAEPDALVRIEAEIKNVQTAWQWLAANGQTGQLLPAMDSLGYFYERHGRYLEGQQSYQSISRQWPERLAADTTGAGHRLLAKALAWQAAFTIDAEEAARLLAQSRALLQSEALAGQDVTLERAFTLWRTGVISVNQSLAAAVSLYRQSLSLYRQANDRWGIIETLLQLAGVHHWNSQFGEAEACFVEILTIAAGARMQWAVVLARLGLADVTIRQGNQETAVSHGDEAVAILASTRPPAYLVNKLVEWQARQAYFTGRFDQAVKHLEQLLALHQEWGHVLAGAEDLGLAGMVHLQMGHYELSARAVAASLDLYPQAGASDHSRISFCYHVKGMLALARQDYAEAERQLQAALTIHHRLNAASDIAEALAFLALALHGLGRTEEAWQLLRQSLPLPIREYNFVSLLEGLLAAGLLLASQDEKQFAVELYSLTMRYSLVANSKFYDDVAGHSIRTLTADLPPAAYQAAWERGQARDLWETAAEFVAPTDAEVALLLEQTNLIVIGDFWPG